MAPPNVLFRATYYTKDSKEYKFYSSQSATNDYLQYVSKGHRQGKYRDYIDYTGNTEKSYGAFSSNGILTSKERKDIRDRLRTTDAQIWSCLISFEEEYGKTHLRSYRDAKTIIEEEFPKFLKENRMEFKNIIWFAGVHENTDNRHIHICFFEKQPLRTSPDDKEKGLRYHNGPLSKKSIDDLKVRIEQRMSNVEYDIKSERNKILDQTDEYLDKVVDPYVEFDKSLKEKLLNVYKKLPKGSFGYENRKLDIIRNDIDDITSHYLINEPGANNSYLNILNKLSNYDVKTKTICESQHIEPDSYLIYNKFKNDIYRRIGNQIINYVGDSKNLSINGLINSNKKERLNEKKRISYLLNNVSRLDMLVSKDRMETFDEFERLMEQANIQRLKEERII